MHALKTMDRNLLLFFVYSLTFLFVPATELRAQSDVSFIADAPSEAGLNDHIEVTYTIRNAENLRTLNPGKFSDFQILAGPFQSQSTNLSIVNGRRTQTQTISLTYILKPLRTGRLSIPAAEAKDAGNNTYVSNKLQVQVVPGTLSKTPGRKNADPFGDDPMAAAQQRRQQSLNAASGAAAKSINTAQLADDLFMKVEVDKTTARVGEQLTATYKLYTRIPMQISISKLPSLNGFWTQDFDIPKTPKPVEEEVHGRKYQVFIIKRSALFPQQSGTLTLDAAEASGFARIVQKVRQRNPFSDMFDDDPFFRQAFGGSLSMSDPFFNDDFFSAYAYQDVPVNLKSKPVRITVNPLPAGKPESFDGAVGQFQMTANWDKTHFSTDEQTTLTLVISGTGNLKLFGPPRLSLPNGLVAYEPQIEDTITGRSTAIAGKKIIQYTLSSRRPGNYEIPPVAFSYFDPATNRYITLQSKSTRLSITPGSGLAALTQPKEMKGSTAANWIKNPWVWSLMALPVLAGFAVAFGRRQARWAAHRTAHAKEAASKQAARRLATAHEYMAQGAPALFYEEVSKAVWLYLSQQLHIPISALSRQTAFAALDKRSISDDVKASLIGVIDQCEQALYAPGFAQQQMKATYEQAATVITQLEQRLGTT